MCKKMKIAIAQPLKEHRQECLWYRGRARCFESWMTILDQTRNSATESIPASRLPSPALTLGLWPPVGSNTETDDDCRRRQFSIGKLSVRKLPFQSNNSR